MKKLLISGLGLMMVTLMAMPAAAENGSGHRGDGDKAGKSYQNKYFGQRAYKKDLKKEQREYQRERRQNIHAMKRADSPRERKNIKKNMIADWRDYKHDVQQIKKKYHHKNHPQAPAYNHHKKGHANYHHHAHKHSHRVSQLAIGLWF